MGSGWRSRRATDVEAEFHEMLLPTRRISNFHVFSYQLFLRGTRVFGTRAPLLTDEVSKYMRRWRWKRLTGRKLGRIDSVKPASKLVDLPSPKAAMEDWELRVD